MCSNASAAAPGGQNGDLAARLGSAIDDLALAARRGAAESDDDLATRLAAAWALIGEADPVLAERVARYAR